MAGRSPGQPRRHARRSRSQPDRDWPRGMTVQPELPGLCALDRSKERRAAATRGASLVLLCNLDVGARYKAGHDGKGGAGAGRPSASSPVTNDAIPVNLVSKRSRILKLMDARPAPSM